MRTAVHPVVTLLPALAASAAEIWRSVSLRWELSSNFVFDAAVLFCQSSSDIWRIVAFSSIMENLCKINSTFSRRSNSTSRLSHFGIPSELYLSRRYSAESWNPGLSPIKRTPCSRRGDDNRTFLFVRSRLCNCITRGNCGSYEKEHSQKGNADGQRGKWNENASGDGSPNEPVMAGRKWINVCVCYRRVASFLRR